MHRASRQMATLLSSMRRVSSDDVIMVGEGPASRYVNAAGTDTIDGIWKKIKEEPGRNWPKVRGTAAMQGRPKPGGKSQGKGKLAGKGKARG